MKLKDYSMRIKKNIAVFLHILFLFMAVLSISVIFLNNSIGTGISWLFDRNYDDSASFRQQFQADLDHVFKYVAYRDVFETDGSLDLSKEMFAVSRDNGPEITYTLEEVLRYAKSQGFYLNDNFEVVNDLFIYDNASTSKDQLVYWRAYDPNATLSEPGDAFSSLLDLSKEVLNCLSEYYIVNYRFLSNPSNFRFRIDYLEDGNTIAEYSNADELTDSQLKLLGRYCSVDSNSILIDSNLDELPKNVVSQLEQLNQLDADSYHMTVAVDTGYSADDIYARQAADYRHLRNRFAEALFCLAIGIIGCIATLYYLVLVSGYRTEDSETPYLHGFDMITTESGILLTAVSTMFMLFLGEKIGYPLIHLLARAEDWSFVERMLRSVIVYSCCLIGAFSLLRRYKSRILWTNSMLCHMKERLDLYFADHTYTRRLFCLFTAFLAAQIGGICLIFVCFSYRSHMTAKILGILLVILLTALDLQTFHRMFLQSRQEDQIADAIAKIAGGDTGYQMNIAGLEGKELKIGNMINSIGTGLERALQEQVKSERLKADLITNVSHDIKTPLTSIINYIDLLKREQIPGERAREYLKVLEQKSQRLKNLTEDLVEASKASSGNVKLEMMTLDLVEMIWQTNGEFEEKFATRNLELVSTLPESSILIEADGRHLWRVLENVYNNAFKYAMEHTRVYTDLEQKDDKVYFTIKNISANPLNVQGEELTERFVRGDVSRTTEGSGLGLSIAQSLTKLQGGTFEILIDGDLFKVRVGFGVKKRDQS